MNVALIFAGGIGSRMGSETPKQFLEWNGKAIIIHTLNVFEEHPDIDAIVIACKEEWIDYLNNLISKYGLSKVKKVVPGGATGQLSIYNGLCAAEEIRTIGKEYYDMLTKRVTVFLSKTPEVLEEQVARAKQELDDYSFERFMGDFKFSYAVFLYSTLQPVLSLSEEESYKKVI